MCGVAALFSYHYASLPIDPDELRLIRDAMEKRGPDGFGEWFSKDGRVGLGHRRLSIIDLSEDAKQPMSSEDGSLVLSFNGEIYNYKELRAALEKKGFKFCSRSDTEVLLKLYREKGEAMVFALRGMFSFALWDARKKKLLLVRDPFGIKPLYYADDGWTVRVASQVKALLKSPNVSRVKEPAGIAGFFLTGSVPEPFTFYQAIRAVPAGHFVRVDNLGPSEPKPYFSIAKLLTEVVQNHDAADPAQDRETARQALLESVRYHFVSDVPVGIFLSSGIDSASLVGLAREAGVRDLETVTVAFPEFKGSPDDESELAEAVAKLYHTKHSTRFVTEQDFRSDFSKILEAMDQPSIDGVNTYFAGKIAAEQKLKVALSGVGGDELFGGYPSYGEIPNWARKMKLFGLLPFFGKISRSLLSRILPADFSPKAAGVAEYGPTYEGAYLLRRGLFMPWELSSFLKGEMAEEGLRRLHLSESLRSSMHPDPKNSFARVLCLEASFYMRNQLLRDSDWAGMAHSLEIRVPFVDSELLRKISPLLLGARETNKKRFLTESLSTPPPEGILRRKKTGFSVPIARWLESKDMDAWRREPRLAKKGCHWARRWAYNLYERIGLS